MRCVLLLIVGMSLSQCAAARLSCKSYETAHKRRTHRLLSLFLDTRTGAEIREPVLGYANSVHELGTKGRSRLHWARLPQTRQRSGQDQRDARR